jgi:hypothetical protein
MATNVFAAVTGVALPMLNVAPPLGLKIANRFRAVLAASSCTVVVEVDTDA